MIGWRHSFFMEKVAIIGGGLSGLVSAYLLNDKYDVTLFDEKSYLGGHSYTHHMKENNQDIEIDLGFMLFNQRGYPNFIKLLQSLNVPLHKSDLSFSFSSRNKIEYKGPQLGNPFSPRKNLLNKISYKLFRDIRKFNQAGKEWLLSNPSDISLEDFIQKFDLSHLVLTAYIFPLLNTLLSIPREGIRQISSLFIMHYMNDNGLFENFFKPPWYFLRGGAPAYLSPLCRPFKQNIHLQEPIKSIERGKYNITVSTQNGPKIFDKLVLGIRADQALKALFNPSPLEEYILGSFKYSQRNIFLHTDKSLMPTNSSIWAGLNYREQENPILTYHANKVQDFQSAKGYFITMSKGNPVSESKIIKKTELIRPIISLEARKNQSRYHEINGILNTYYCGSYWGYGTHEDAVSSAYAACAPLLLS